jgi:hypothetical protein
MKTLFACLFALSAFAPAAAQSARPAPGVGELHRLDALPSFKRSVAVGSVSSYDRKGGNDDGFVGTYSFVRKEEAGLVVADLKGPGVVYRIWTATPSDDIIKFYFDGEASPRLRLPFIDLFSGRQYPFVPPVAGVGAGGFYSYVPLPYKESLKVVVKSDHFNFYQLNYATYPEGSGVESYAAEPSAAFKADLERARELLSAPGADVSRFAAPAGHSVQTRRFTGALAPGQSFKLFESDRPGRVVGLRLGPASSFAGKARDLVLRAYWDGEASPAINCPVGDFFGYSWGEPAVKSALLGTNADTDYVYLPMPFDRSARIELVSERREGAPVPVEGEVQFTDVGRSSDEGRLYALWRRESPTTAGRPFTFVEAKGRGHVVGFILQAQGARPGEIPEFFEGDDETYIDGQLAVHGTGSEDFFNGAWYDVPGRWESRVSLPLSGSLDFKRYLGRTGGYRFLLTDAYSFKQSVVSTIEHGPAGNNFLADYVGVTFLYAEQNPLTDAGLPPVAARRVTDPNSVVFTPGWNTPIHAFSWANAVLLKKDDLVGGEQLRHLSLQAEGREVFGPHYISFICEMPAAGKYRVSIQAIEGPTQGVVQLFLNEVGVGPAHDLYSAERRKSKELPLGELDLKEGDNRVMLKLVGKNSLSKGTGLDLYRIIFERVG